MDFPQTLNINARTKVVLTKVGADVLNDYFRQYHLGITEQTKQWEEEHFPTTYKEGDVFETELHHIMHIFGYGLIPGNDIPFKNNEVTFLRI